MSAQSDILAKTQERLTLWYEAETALISGGSQSYSIGNRTLTRVDAKIISDMIDKLEKKLLLYGRGGTIRAQRVVPRDI
jgi:hypothetical protein